MLAHVPSGAGHPGLHHGFGKPAGLKTRSRHVLSVLDNRIFHLSQTAVTGPRPPPALRASSDTASSYLRRAPALNQTAPVPVVRATTADPVRWRSNSAKTASGPATRLITLLGEWPD